MIRLGMLGTLICAYLLSTNALVHAQDSKSRLCRNLYKQKQYKTASQCYQNLASSIPNAKLSSPTIRYQKGRWLRNATLLQRKVAFLAKEFKEKRYLFEQVKQKLTQYLREKLYETNYQRQLAQKMLTNVTQRIGYATLSITCLRKDGILTLVGYKYQMTQRHQWQGKLRAGRYTLQVRYPGQSPKTQQLELAPGQSKRLAIAAPTLPRLPPKRPLPPPPRRSWGWIVFGVGAAAIVGGAVVLGVGMGTIGQRDALQQQANDGTLPAGITAKDFNALDESATWQLALGGSLIGAGTLGAIIGLVAQMQAPSKTRGTTP